jgi:hypothetical protein
MAYVVRRTTHVRTKDWRKPEVIHIMMAQPAQYVREHLTGKEPSTLFGTVSSGETSEKSWDDASPRPSITL